MNHNKSVMSSDVCFYLAATLSRGLVAVFMKSPLRVTVTGSTHGIAPPPLRTRLLHSVIRDKVTFIKAAITNISIIAMNQKTR